MGRTSEPRGKERHEWIRDHIGDVDSYFELVVVYNEEFDADMKVESMRAHASAAGVKLGKCMQWTEEQTAFLAANYVGVSYDESAARFEERFGFRPSRSQMDGKMRPLGLKRGTGSYHRMKPVGSTRIANGYEFVKTEGGIGKTNVWRPRSEVEWERHHGEPLPDGCVVMFANHDKRDFSERNLVAVPKSMRAKVSCIGYCDRETLDTAIALANMEDAVKGIKYGERTCEVCGKPFVPFRESNEPSRRCRECFDAGRGITPKRRGTGKRVKCAVCGDEFDQSVSNQVRCPACIEEKPSWSVKAHRRHYELTGRR